MKKYISLILSFLGSLFIIGVFFIAGAFTGKEIDGFENIVIEGDIITEKYYNAINNLLKGKKSDGKFCKFSNLQGIVCIDDATSLNISQSVITNRTNYAPSEKAVKEYVDAQVGASNGGAGCPTQITEEKQVNETIPRTTGSTSGGYGVAPPPPQYNDRLLIDAIKGCRSMGGGYRLPTVEELSCFIGDDSIPGGLGNKFLFTRTPFPKQVANEVWVVGGELVNTPYWYAINILHGTHIPVHSAFSKTNYGKSVLYYRCVR